MSFSEIVLVFCVNLVYIGAKAFQQLSVVHDSSWRVIFPVSYIMSYCEVYMWSGAAIYAVGGEYLISAVYATILGTSSGIGTKLSMEFHKVMRRNE